MPAADLPSEPERERAPDVALPAMTIVPTAPSSRADLTSGDGPPVSAPGARDASEAQIAETATLQRRADELAAEAHHEHANAIEFAAAAAADLAGAAAALAQDDRASREPREVRHHAPSDDRSDSASNDDSSNDPPEPQPDLLMSADPSPLDHHGNRDGDLRDRGPAEVGLAHPDASPWNGRTSIGTISSVDGDRAEQYAGRGQWTSFSIASDLHGVVPEVGSSVQINGDGTMQATPEQQLVQTQALELDRGRALT